MFSLDECVPKRPPRAQKLPVASGTVQLATPIGRASLVISAIQSICRASAHSFTSDSSTMATKSRGPAILVARELADVHFQQRKNRVRSDIGRHRQPANLGNC